MAVNQAGAHPPVLPDEAREAVARAWLTELADQGRLARLQDDALVADLKRLAEVGRIADAGRVFAARVVADRSRTELGGNRLCTRGGFTTPQELVAQVSGESKQAATRRIRQAEPLQPGRSFSGEPIRVPFPLVRAAVAAGLMSPDVSGVITGALHPCLEHGGNPSRVAEGERALVAAFLGEDVIATHPVAFAGQVDALLEQARQSGTCRRGVPVAQVTRMTRTWQRLLSQEAAAGSACEAQRQDAERERQKARRFVKILPLKEGTHHLEGELLPDVAAQLQLVLDAFGSPKIKDVARGVEGSGPDVIAGSPGATGRGGSGAGASAAGPRGAGAPQCVLDPRSYDQRMHDYFAGFVAIAAGFDGVPRPAAAAPTLVVTVSRDQLLDPHGIAFLAGTHHEADSAVEIAVAHHVGCVGHVWRQVCDQNGAIVELTSTDRVFTAAQRKVLADRDGGCVIWGCEVPASWCEVHHVQEHQDGGLTDTSNGTLLCFHHHRELAALGWEIEMRRGMPWLRPPASVDLHRTWAPAQSSAHRHFDHLRRHDPASRASTAGGSGTTADSRSAPTPPDHPDRTGPPLSDAQSDWTGAPEWARPIHVPAPALLPGRSGDPGGTSTSGAGTHASLGHAVGRIDQRAADEQDVLVELSG